MTTDTRETAGRSEGSPPPRRKISRTRFVCYLLLSWLTVVGVAEVGLRVAGFAPSPAAKVPAHYDPFQPHDDLIWALKPNWSGFELNGAVVQTNSHGLRGPETTRTPADSVQRILFLGDSVVYGHGLAETLTISSQLQAQLNQETPGSQVEVLNAGVPGYSTFQSELYFRLQGKSLEADLVLLGFCFNDVTERYTTVATYGGRRIFMQNVDTSTGMGWPRRLWQQTAIRQALVTMRRGAAQQGERFRVTKLWTDASAPHIQTAWQRVFGEVERLAGAVDEAGAKFAVVIFPYSVQLSEEGPGDGPQRTMIQHLQSLRIPVLSLLEPLKETGGPPEMFFVDDNHFSGSGSLAAAKQISRFIDENGLLTDR